MQRFAPRSCQLEQTKNMKPLRFGLFAGLLIAFVSCKKTETTDCSLVPVKVLRYDCDRVILQVLSADAIGDSSWTDVFSGQTYNNVVSYYNTCEIAAITNGELQTLYVKMEPAGDEQLPSDCVQCLAISQDPPQSRVKMTVISTTPCEGGGNMVSCY